jgi:uncharacterized protein YheU (UPF0270 family)
MIDSEFTEVPVLIPPEQLSEEALAGIVESFVLREGTDYGLVEIGHDKKILQVRKQVACGTIKIVYDLKSQSVTLLTARDFQKLMSSRK